MKNVTLAFPDDLLLQGRKYAQKHHTTLNALIRDTLARRVMPSKQPASTLELFTLMDEAHIVSRGSWKREDLYRV